MQRLVDVTDDETRAVTLLLHQTMPDAAVVLVQRNLHELLYHKYVANRDAVEAGSPGAPLERWLWNGNDSLEENLGHGFDVRFASKEFNKYGVGVYFAADARLSAFFERGTRDSTGQKKLLLARVALGNMAERGAVPGFARQLSAGTSVNPELLKPEWSMPPSGAHSATSRNRIEAIVYENHQAFPHYLVTYTAGPRTNPYGGGLNPPLRKIDAAPINAEIRVRNGKVSSFLTPEQERQAAEAAAAAEAARRRAEEEAKAAAAEAKRKAEAARQAAAGTRAARTADRATPVRGAGYAVDDVRLDIGNPVTAAPAPATVRRTHKRSAVIYCMAGIGVVMLIGMVIALVEANESNDCDPLAPTGRDGELACECTDDCTRFPKSRILTNASWDDQINSWLPSSEYIEFIVTCLPHCSLSLPLSLTHFLSLRLSVCLPLSLSLSLSLSLLFHCCLRNLKPMARIAQSGRTRSGCCATARSCTQPTKPSSFTAAATNTPAPSRSAGTATSTRID
jgi:hypothetical protein